MTELLKPDSFLASFLHTYAFRPGPRPSFPCLVSSEKYPRDVTKYRVNCETETNLGPSFSGLRLHERPGPQAHDRKAVYPSHREGIIIVSQFKQNQKAADVRCLCSVFVPSLSTGSAVVIRSLNVFRSNRI